MCLFLNKLRPDCLWHIVDSDVEAFRFLGQNRVLMPIFPLYIIVLKALKIGNKVAFFGIIPFQSKTVKNKVTGMRVISHNARVFQSTFARNN